MRLKQYLIEKTPKIKGGEITKEDLPAILQILKRDCAPYFKQKSKNDNLFIGKGQKLSVGFEKRKIRTNRKPTDTPLPIHNYLDEIFSKIFGWKARSNSIFASTSEGLAIVYGATQLLFPIGNFKFVYSAEIGDLYEFLGGGIIDIAEMYPHSEEYLYDLEDILYSSGGFASLNDAKKFTEICKKYGFLENIIMDNYIDKSLKKAMELPNIVEIMINCKEYYILNYENFKKIINSKYYVDGVNFDKLFKDYNI